MPLKRFCAQESKIPPVHGGSARACAKDARGLAFPAHAHPLQCRQKLWRAHALRGGVAEHQHGRAHRAGRAQRRGQVDALLYYIRHGGEPDSGSVVLDKHTTLGFLPQETAATGDETVLELACSVTEEHGRLMRILADGARTGQTETEEYHDALGRYAELGGYQLEPKAKRILSGLAFRESDFNRPAREMSGGWIMRAHLARLLVMEPDLLMLDEPTNHLDLESLGWFQNYLEHYPGSILMISHDRAFLNALVDNIWENPQQAGASLPRKLRCLSRAAPGPRRAAPRRVQKPAGGDREAAGIRRPLPRQGQQGLPGAEQAQADRAHGKDRGAGRPGQENPHQVPAARAQRQARDDAHRRPLCLRRPEGLPGHRPGGREGPAHRVGRAQRRGQIDAAENSWRRAGHPGRRAQGGSQLRGRLLLAEPHRDAEPDAHRAAGGTQHTRAAPRSDHAHHPRLVPLPGRRRVQEGERALRRREDAPRPGEAPAQPAQPAAHGRADDAPRHGLDRCAHRSAQAVHRHAGLHQPRRLFHPRARADGPAHQRKAG